MVARGEGLTCHEGTFVSEDALRLNELISEALKEPSRLWDERSGGGRSCCIPRGDGPLTSCHRAPEEGPARRGPPPGAPHSAVAPMMAPTARMSSRLPRMSSRSRLEGVWCRLQQATACV